MNKIQERRLRKLANHLLELEHDKFDFDSIQSCAIGQLTVLFPRVFKLIETSAVTAGLSWNCQRVRNEKTGFADFTAAQEYFGLDGDETLCLFMPLYRELPWLNGRKLGGTASAKKVANSILKFIEWRKAGNKLEALVAVGVFNLRGEA